LQRLVLLFYKQKIELEPLLEGHTELEVELRANLVSVLQSYPGLNENAVNRALNATNRTLHIFSTLFTQTLEVIHRDDGVH